MVVVKVCAELAQIMDASTAATMRSKTRNMLTVCDEIALLSRESYRTIVARDDKIWKWSLEGDSSFVVVDGRWEREEESQLCC